MFRIICGLGNPGSRYDGTRHNIGFMAIDQLAGSTTQWRERDGLLLSELSLPSGKVSLCKPQTFMNRSGEPLAALANFFKVPPSEIAVLHDDIDLPFGAIRIRNGGGEGGHNGLRSVTTQLGTSDYTRVKLGVGRPQTQSDGEVVDWVLQRFGSTEQAAMSEFLDRAVKATECLIVDGVLKAQNRFNTKIEKPAAP